MQRTTLYLVIFIVGILSLSFLANRNGTWFCDGTDAPASCVRGWMEALAPWIAIAVAIHAVRPILRQLQEMQIQTALSRQATLRARVETLNMVRTLSLSLSARMTELVRAPRDDSRGSDYFRQVDAIRSNIDNLRITCPPHGLLFSDFDKIDVLVSLEDNRNIIPEIVEQYKLVGTAEEMAFVALHQAIDLEESAKNIERKINADNSRRV